MISLEQIRLLEGKISRAIELIRVLKEENSSLRKGVDSAQKRVKELEALVDGLKTDQREIESVIVRTLKNLDDIEEQIHGQAAGQGPAAPPEPPKAAAPSAHKAERAAAAPPRPAAPSAEKPAAPAAEKPVQPPPEKAPAPEKPAPVSEKAAAVKAPPQTVEAAVSESSKGELDIF